VRKLRGLALEVAHAAVGTGGEMGCVAQGFLIGVMLAGEAKEHLLLAVMAALRNIGVFPSRGP
jgi:hypothetical protein